MKLIARIPTFVPGKPPDPPMQGPLHSPKRQGDVGFDLQAVEDTLCAVGVITYVHTGVHVHVEKGLWYTIAGRSSLTKQGGIVPFNVIDAEYQGELLVGVYNTGPELIKIKSGERIAQLIFFQNVRPDFQEVREYPGSERGAQGFGSTGR